MSALVSAIMFFIVFVKILINIRRQIWRQFQLQALAQSNEASQSIANRWHICISLFESALQHIAQNLRFWLSVESQGVCKCGADGAGHRVVPFGVTKLENGRTKHDGRHAEDGTDGAAPQGGR